MFAFETPKINYRISASSGEHFREPCKGLRFSKASIERFVAALLTLLLSLLIMPFYTESDQLIYRRVYEELPYLSLTEGFLFYRMSTDSYEFVHFILSWVASRFIEKDLFIAFSNSVFAYVAMILFQKWKVPVIISFLLILTNYYFLVLYFSAERLKYGFIFIALSMIYLKEEKRFGSFTILAIISHLQFAIIYLSILFHFLCKKFMRALQTARLSKSVLHIAILTLIFMLLLNDHIVNKFTSYYVERDLTALAKMIAFFFLAIWYSKNKFETLAMFIPLFVVTYLVGGERVNIFGYCIFLYYGLQYKSGWNFGVLSTCAYFSYASIDFVTRIIYQGAGFGVH